MAALKLSFDLGENYHGPMRFVECAELAEKYGCDTVWFGDHLLPWIHGGNRSAFVWSVMATALDRTKSVRIGPNVTCPIGGRYHPAIIAQAAATLDNMYPGRFSLGVGSGEAVGEANFFHGAYPKWRQRTERLCEAVVLMRRIWESPDYFDFPGRYFPLKNFYLYTKPKTKIPIYFSAIGRKAASFAGTYGDHLVTLNSPEVCRDVMFPLFDSAARKTGKDLAKMEKMVVLDLFFGDRNSTPENVRDSGEAGPLADGAFEETDPRKIEKMSLQVSDERIVANKVFFSSPDELIDTIDRYWKVGATHLDLVTQSFPERITVLGEKVLPYFAELKDHYHR